MKIVGYCALHYGSDYLGWAIRSIIDYIDELHVLYAKEGSHGHRTDLPCPDTREELLAIARAAGGKKLRWWDGEWTNEGAQRMTVHQVAPDADVILVLDCDEIWPEAIVSRIGNLWTDYRVYKIPVVSFWRSFYRAMPDIPDFPDRIIYPSGNGEFYARNYPPIAHMGYAQRSELVYYKQFTHGHKGEWRRDIDWYAERFAVNAQADCYPCGVGRWTPEAVNPLDYMPAWMAEHPFFNRQVIE